MPSKRTSSSPHTSSQPARARHLQRSRQKRTREEAPHQMPRLAPRALRGAARLSPHAAALLPACRDLPSALRELRWIREHVAGGGGGGGGGSGVEARVAALCRRRGRGEPLQYVLGSVPFGELEMLCRPGVLIPRPEPEAYTAHLAHLISTHALPALRSQQPPHGSSGGGLTILDLCTGTGCIALLLHARLLAAAAARMRPACLHTHGVDISPRAVRLARRNTRHNHHHLARALASGAPSPQQQQQQHQQQQSSSLAFTEGDIFSSSWLREQQRPVDVLVCNPPYVSPWGFAHHTERSVRNYEPKLAQVPMAAAAPAYAVPLEDVFYARLLEVAVRTRARVMLFEVGDLTQALRVVDLAWAHGGLKDGGRRVDVQVWRDWPDAAPREDEQISTTCEVDGESRMVSIKGSGHGRSVLIQCS